MVTPKARERDAQGHEWRRAESSFPGWFCKSCDVYAPGEAPPTDTKRCPGDLTINIRLDGDYALKVGQVWPDGDYPDEITAEAVAELMKEQGRYALRSDWCLEPSYAVSVGAGAEVDVDV